MDSRNEHNNKESQEPAPEQLTNDLQELYGANLIVPAHVDETILSQAKRQLSRKTGRRNWHWAAAAAAVVLLTVGLLTLSDSESPSAPPPSPALAKEDIDRDGRVDILDAFALARKIESTSQLDLTEDINRDGRVDRRDVEAIAHRAVRLNGEAL